MDPLVFVTGSNNKLAEAERILGFRIERQAFDLDEIQSVEVEDVVKHKARLAYSLVGKPVMIEDTGLYIETWNGLPGALVKWFIERVNVTGICEMLKHNSNRSAYAKTVVTVFDGEYHIFEGVVRGLIVDSPRGNKGFGWDPIFAPEGIPKTFAEMEPDEKDRYSMRKIALQRMREYFRK